MKKLITDPKNLIGKTISDIDIIEGFCPRIEIETSDNHIMIIDTDIAYERCGNGIEEITIDLLSEHDLGEHERYGRYDLMTKKERKEYENKLEKRRIEQEKEAKKRKEAREKKKKKEQEKKLKEELEEYKRLKEKFE